MYRVRYAALALLATVLPYRAAADDVPTTAAAPPSARTVQTSNRPSTSGTAHLVQLSEAEIVAAISDAASDPARLAAFWEFFADRTHARLATLPAVKALASASTDPHVREALWSELAALAKAPRNAPTPQAGANANSLLSLFEQHRSELLPLLPPVPETEGAGDEMARLMTASEVFGDDIWSSFADMVKRNPAAVARYIERQRERGQPVKWEYQGFEGLMQWRDQHFIAALQNAHTPPDVLDAAGETFISIFNSMHTLDDWFRVQMLKGLGPGALFNAVVSGEQQLYRLGTSGYRDFLHPIIMKGIKDSGTFEAFLARIAITQSGSAGARTSAAKRGLVFLRIASSFGLLDSVLETVRDRDAFVSEAIAALGDPRAFESSSTIVLDIVTGRSATPPAEAFKRALLDRLYALYETEKNPAHRAVFGSMLSAYQTVTGDRRSAAIDRAFPLDPKHLHIPFARLFKAAADGGDIHRMFMRMPSDLDGERTFASVHTLMKSLKASVQDEKNYVIFRLATPQRKIEIYVNAPTAAGVRHGIAGIAATLRTTGAETVVGRGHTGIIAPMQADARRVLGDSVRSAAVVIVGTCGSDASVREMIGTFGFVPFITTKSSGHQSINNAILARYIRELQAMPHGGTLSISAVLDRALAYFLTEEANEELREDARLYRVNVATALAAQLFETHLRPYTGSQLRVSR